MAPGVTVEAFEPAAAEAFRTGVPGFLCPAIWAGSQLESPLTGPLSLRFGSWPDFASTYRDAAGRWREAQWRPDEWTWNAVQGFFLNGGTACWLVLYYRQSGGDTLRAIDRGVEALAALDEIDLVCAPALSANAANAEPLHLAQLIRSAETPGRRDDWFLVLDGPADSLDERALKDWVSALRAAPCGRPGSVAVYAPWVLVGGDFELAPGSLGTAGGTPTPPSGHVAGVFARTDSRAGVHKAPANEVIQGILDLAPAGPEVTEVNALRALPGRGLRVWGARTLALPLSPSDPIAFINIQRFKLTLARWLVRALDWTAFEPHDAGLWARIRRELGSHLNQLFLEGALGGASADQAFSIQCDAENNPSIARAQGELHVDVHVVPALSKERIKIHIVRSADGVAAL